MMKATIFTGSLSLIGVSWYFDPSELRTQAVRARQRNGEAAPACRCIQGVGWRVTRR